MRARRRNPGLWDRPRISLRCIRATRAATCGYAGLARCVYIQGQLSPLRHNGTSRVITGTAVSAPFWMVDPAASNRGGISDKPARLMQPIGGVTLVGRGALSMRRDQRKSRLLQEWQHWLQTQPLGRRRPTARDTLKFFYELQDMRSPLLDFRSGRRDKWRVIHDWLLGEENVSAGVSRSRSVHRRAAAAEPPRAARKKKAAPEAPPERGRG